MATNLHHVGTMLNLYKLDELSINEDAYVKLFFLDAMKRLITYIDGQHSEVVARLKYSRIVKMHLPICSSHGSQNSTPCVVGPCGESGTHLTTLAKCILAQVCYSLSCERNWSSFSFLHITT